MSTIKSNVIQMTSAAGDVPNTASLKEAVRDSLEKYFNTLDGNDPSNVYNMVLQQIEQPLMEIVMEHVDGNQSRAAECLGLNRGTLRKKLKMYDLL
jgi:Fis family transcriptional regulator, factor for inversion stimulation protein